MPKRWRSTPRRSETGVPVWKRSSPPAETPTKKRWRRQSTDLLHDGVDTALFLIGSTVETVKRDPSQAYRLELVVDELGSVVEMVEVLRERYTG